MNSYTSASSCDAHSKIQVTPKTSGGTGLDKRVAVHSHIRGLGLTLEGAAVSEDSPSGGSSSVAGFIGQKTAREACGYAVDLVKSRRMGGRGMLLVGAPSTGKTALALAVAHELGSHVPFVPMVGSEVYSAEVKKTEVLMEGVRRALGLAVTETKDVYEGEVTQLNPVETESPLAPGSFSGKTISAVMLSLKAQKGTKTLKLDPSLLEVLQKEGIRIGDVITLESASGAVTRLGRSEAFRHEVDLEAELFVPLPKGEVFRKKQMLQRVTLHDLDVANARPSNSGGAGNPLLEAVLGLGTSHKTEITDKLRGEIDRVVDKHIEEGTGELVPGVLFIDEAHLLDLDCFTFLNRMMESPSAPLIILATNRGLAPLRGMTLGGSANEPVPLVPHGFPSDFLDRLFIVRAEPYSAVELRGILACRAKMEGLVIEAAALDNLQSLATEKHSLRYALQLLLPSKSIAAFNGRDTIAVGDVEAAADLFLTA